MVSEALTCSGVVGASRRVMAESSQFGEGGVEAEGGWGGIGVWWWMWSCGGGVWGCAGVAHLFPFLFLFFLTLGVAPFFSSSLFSFLSTGRG